MKIYNITKFNSLITFFAVFYCSNTSIVQYNTSPKVEQAHAEIWARFMDKNGIMHSFADLAGKVYLPSPSECKEGKPNALGWWTPIENGAMFSGLYMDGAVMRWERTRLPADAEKARKLSQGLMLLASISDVAGFVGRGVSTDGISHYPMGSNDQMGGWFYGLWRYLQTDIPTADERAKIKEKLLSTAHALVAANWLIPAEPPYNFRGGFNSFDHNSARRLFVAKVAYILTNDIYWNQIYQQSLYQVGGSPARSRLAIVAAGLPYVFNKTSTWDESASACCLRSLWEMEQDPAIKEAYRQGLEINATNGMKSLALANGFPNPDSVFIYDIDWRKMNVFWKPQATQYEAVEIAMYQVTDFRKRVKRFDIENQNVREPLFGAWLVTLAPDQSLLLQRAPELKTLIEKYNYKSMYTSWFFPVEAIWWRLDAIL